MALAFPRAIGSVYLLDQTEAAIDLYATIKLERKPPNGTQNPTENGSVKAGEVEKTIVSTRPSPPPPPIPHAVS